MMSIYNHKVANISREDIDELMAILHAPEEKPLSDEDRWRCAYQEEQRRKRVVGYQQDLFGRATVTHYRHNPPAPDVERPPIETVEAKLERIRHDRCATFGPPRSDRPAYLSAKQKAAIVRATANWLRVGQRVRLIDAPGTVDPAFGNQRYLGRAGVVWRLCRSFTDQCYVFLDPAGGERTDKIIMVELRDLEPLV